MRGQPRKGTAMIPQYFLPRSVTVIHKPRCGKLSDFALSGPGSFVTILPPKGNTAQGNLCNFLFRRGPPEPFRSSAPV
jgi:hypothetical protein